MKEEFISLEKKHATSLRILLNLRATKGMQIEHLKIKLKQTEKA